MSFRTRTDSSLLHKSSKRIKRQNSSIDVEIPEENKDNEEEEIWMETMDSRSITPEHTSLYTDIKGRPDSCNRVWNKLEITAALSKLPSGESAMSLLASLSAEKLELIKQNIKDFKFSHSDSKPIMNVPYLNGAPKKKSLSTEDVILTDTENLIKNFPNTCLLVSCWLGKTDVVKLLLHKGVKATFKDCAGRSGLHLAAVQRGQILTIRELLNHGANPNEWDNSHEYTPMHCAASAADITSLECLVQFGGDVNSKSSGESVLDCAVFSNSLECVEYLLKNGAAPTNLQVYTETPLHVAANFGYVDCMKLLLEYKANVNVQSDRDRFTALHFAAAESSLECLELLLNAGADCNAVTNRGQTALHLAALSGSTEILRKLIAHGANVHIKDDDGRTPLHAAATRSSIESVRILIDASNDLINTPDKFGYTPLHIAALSENSSIVIFLLAKGADVTAKTKGNISALSFIARRTPEVVPKFVSRLDQAITLSECELGDIDCEIKLDFKPLLSENGRGETELMLCLVEVGQRHILHHPLCESFLHLKWEKCRKFFLANLIFYSLFVAAFSSYIGEIIVPGEYPEIKICLFWIVIVFSIICFFKEIFQIAHCIKTYTLGVIWETTLQWSVLAFVLLVCITDSIVHGKATSWQPHVAAIGILLSWIQLMMVVSRFPIFGIYIEMFTQVAANFFKFIGAYMCLIMGFCFAFCVLHKNYQSFSNLGVGFLKTIVMMSGEVNFEEMFFSEDMPVLYNGTSHVMFLAFVILVTIILTNLMVGLAVSDIQELQRCAGLSRLVRRAQLVAHLERWLFSKVLDYAPDRIVKPIRQSALLKSNGRYCSVYVKPNDRRDQTLPKDLKQSICELVTEKKNQRTKISGTSMRFPSELKKNYVARSATTRPHSSEQLEKVIENISLKLDSLTKTIEILRKELNVTG